MKRRLYQPAPALLLPVALVATGCSTGEEIEPESKIAVAQAITEPPQDCLDRADDYGAPKWNPDAGQNVIVVDYMGLNVGSAIAASTQYGTTGDDWICVTKSVGCVGDTLSTVPLEGNGGHDIIIGSEETDYLSVEGCSGRPVSSGRIYAGGGNDVLYGTDGPDVLFGGSGADTIYGNMGEDTIHGGPGNDKLYGFLPRSDAPEFDQIQDLFGEMLLSKNPDNDTLDGGSGSDYIVAGPDMAHIVQNGDRFWSLASFIGDDGTVDDRDTVQGGTGLDRMYGGIGDDALSPRTSLACGTRETVQDVSRGVVEFRA